MSVSRIALALCALGSGLLAQPAAAQFFLKSHDFEGVLVKGDATGLASPLPGATAAELDAALSWTLRSALNVAALQCQFEPTLNTTDAYNAVLKDHDAEFDKSQLVLQHYFARLPGSGSAKAGRGSQAGQMGFDQFGTRTYSSFSAVSSQYGFCQTAASIGREAVFTKRGTFGDLARSRMTQLRNSLFGSWGDESVSGYTPFVAATLPRLDPICWDKKGNWVDKKCGAQDWPPAA